MADSTLTHAYINTSTKTENLLKKGWSHSQSREERKRKRAVTCHKTHNSQRRRKTGREGGEAFFFGPLFRVVLL